jgi:chromosome segregation ATPase
MTISSNLLTRKKPAEDEQLLRLFWNRAELKKEFAKLRRERDRLTDQLRQQEGATLRAQQRLEQIEGMLAEPLRAANAAVFYQLRGVWHQCRRRLSRLAADLATRQQQREQEHAAQQGEPRREEAVLGIDRRLAELAQRRRSLEGDLAHLIHRREALGSIWHYFKRRYVVAQQQAVEASLASLLVQQERQALAREERLAQLGSTDATLSVEGRRMVNLSVIALGQELLLHFQQHGIARLAREAATRKLGDVTYGSADECRSLARHIEQAQRALDGLGDLPSRVRRRAGTLAREAHYRRETDTVPVAGSFDLVPLDPGLTSAAAGPTGSMQANILAEEYWDIYNILLT